MLKKPTNKGLKKLPTEVRNKMGFMKKGGMVKDIKKEALCLVDNIQCKLQKLNLKVYTKRTF